MIVWSIINYTTPPLQSFVFDLDLDMDFEAPASSEAPGDRVHIADLNLVTNAVHGSGARPLGNPRSGSRVARTQMCVGYHPDPGGSARFPAAIALFPENADTEQS